MDSKHQERSNYEKMWQQAFEDAEIRPSADLWRNIDTQLTKQESGLYKRGFLFYRAVAAVCLLCLAGLGIYAINDYIQHQQHSSVTIANDQQERNAPGSAPSETENAVPEKQEAPEEQMEHNPDFSEQNMLAEERPTEKLNTNQNNQQPSSVENAASSKKVLPSAPLAARETSAHSQTASDQDYSTDSYSGTQISLITSSGLYTEPVKGMEWIQQVDQLYQVPNPYGVEQKKEAETKPTFFAGLDFSGNYFDPNFSTNPTNPVAPPTVFDAANLGRVHKESGFVSQSEAPTPGVNNSPQVSFSYEANVGINLSEHLTLESGIDYGKFNSNTETNLALENLNSEKRYPLVVSNSTYANTSNVSFTSATELTNAFEILTIPMKLGYNLNFDKVNLFISSGMAANFFINNSISDASGRFATVNIQAGAGSPYKKSFYSGVVSGGINYNFSGNYFLTLAPEYSFSITPMTKEDAYLNSQPYLFGVDVGIRYKFK